MFEKYRYWIISSQAPVPKGWRRFND